MTAKNAFRLLISLLVLAIVLVPFEALAQQGYHVNVDYVDTRRFPQVGAYVSVRDAQGFLVKNLLDADFTLAEDDKPITGFKLTPVQNVEQPLAVVLVLDASAAMNTRPLPTPLQTSIEAAKAFLGSLQARDQVALLAYADTPTIVSNFVQDKAALSASLDNIPVGNKAAMFDAIADAVGLLKDRSERRVIILITDGRDTRSHTNIDQAIALANQSGVQIYPVGFGAVNVDQLRKLASNTGGSMSIQQSPTALQAAFTQVVQILREQYLLEYTSTLAADGQKHSLKIGATVQGQQVSAHSDFVAQRGEVQVTLPYEDNETVAGNVIIRPEVDAPAPISLLEISLDGTSLAKVTASPYEYIWKSTDAGVGPHLVAVTVTDSSGNTGTASVQLDVQAPITADISEPADQAQVQGPVKIALNVVTVPAGQVGSVEVTVDGQPVGPVSAAPYEVSWDTSRLAPTKHTIHVKAVDVNGFSAEDEVSVFVQPGGGGLGWIAIAAVVALAAIIVPLALRSRRRRGPAAGPVHGSIKGEAGAARLQELEGHNPGQIWPLGATPTRLGRKRDENDIHLKGLSASRRHAVIRLEQGQYWIQGVSPDNPVTVNNEAISGGRALQPGDVIRLGETVLRFERS